MLDHTNYRSNSKRNFFDIRIRIRIRVCIGCFLGLELVFLPLRKQELAGHFMTFIVWTCTGNEFESCWRHLKFFRYAYQTIGKDGQQSVRIISSIHLSTTILKTLISFTCLYILSELMIKVARRQTGHFVTLIEVGCTPGGGGNCHIWAI